ncbi:hypothetical protein Q0590_26075 [Rhodocytophaga aerolata]|uniref:Lipoprotein n=1 Tax=Rhodocytophaga aerolata TaxID=455078 RepID=A0ABT8RF27_9BACT|nr:DUF6624 domain-containing protein [Rhodocytophaga aerolata]MDO1449773.1 hypothetical protein [Rhodocytophaga aerolata]
MNKIVLILMISVFSAVSCNKSSNYKPQGLRKLSDTEIIEHAKTGNYISENTIFKDSVGNIVSRDELRQMNTEEIFGDQYVNADNKIVEVVLRKATNEDKALIKKLKEGFEIEDEAVTIIDIDCSEVEKILEAVYQVDQDNRKGGVVANTDIDKENQQIVVSTIEKCGFPSVEKHGNRSVEAVFLVIQHAGKSLREKYFPQIKKSADQGDLQWSLVALMEDRMLMDRGEKQKYGSQVQKKNGSDKWSLYPIEDPQNVNKRRAQVGLGPIEEYLKHFGIDYNTINENGG